MTDLRSKLIGYWVSTMAGVEAAHLARKVLRAPDTSAFDATSMWRDLIRPDGRRIRRSLYTTAQPVNSPPWVWLEFCEEGHRFGALVNCRKIADFALPIPESWLPILDRAKDDGAHVLVSIGHWIETDRAAHYRALSGYWLNARGAFLNSVVLLHHPSNGNQILTHKERESVDLQMAWTMHSLRCLNTSKGLIPLADDGSGRSADHNSNDSQFLSPVSGVCERAWANRWIPLSRTDGHVPSRDAGSRLERRQHLMCSESRVQSQLAMYANSFCRRLIEEYCPEVGFSVMTTTPT
jgi:hypothetical protein